MVLTASENNENHTSSCDHAETVFLSTLDMVGEGLTEMGDSPPGLTYYLPLYGSESL